MIAVKLMLDRSFKGLARACMIYTVVLGSLNDHLREGEIMKSGFMNSMVIVGLFSAVSAYAVEMPELAKKANCVSCHAIAEKKVGPTWEAIADKYKSEKGAVATLSGKIISGGKGVWGAVPMPPNPKLAEADAKELASFIMKLAK